MSREKPSLPKKPADLPEVSDVRTLRALTHPVRIALLEALTIAGPATATELAELIGETPTTCSFHLRQLAKYGYIEEAGGGKGRQRPWRPSAVGMRLSDTDDDPGATMAAAALLEMLRSRQLKRAATWKQAKSSYPKKWREAASDSQFLAYLTAPELKRLNDDIVELVLKRFGPRIADPEKRPADAMPVEMLWFSYPVELARPQ